jgi:imidazoleglycerol-phosphate dehydratase
MPSYNETLPVVDSYSIEEGKDFLDTFAKNAAINMHVDVYAGQDVHHVLEAVFKALGIALDEATQVDARRKGVPSTKGTID